jgi:two-component system LytT family sensor kinase
MRRRLRESWLILGVWTVVVVVFTLHEYLSGMANGRPVPLGSAFYWSLSEWYTWAVLTPGVFWLVRRFRLTRGAWISHGSILVVAGLGFSLMQILLQYALDTAAVRIFGSAQASVGTWLADTPAQSAVTLPYLLERKIGFDYFIFWVIALAGHLLDYYRLYRDRELAASRLETELMRARLDALRSQLQPHFLFNALNAITQLVHQDPAAAEAMIEDLAELLRRALDTGVGDEVQLEDELALLEAYCAIERARFADRLVVSLDVEPTTRVARVPALLLQPLVENAVRYAVQPREDGGQITVRAARRDARLVLEVEDEGSGLPIPAARGNGIGLSNTRSRLRALYGADHRFDIGSTPEGGTLVHIELPWATGGSRDPAA